MKIPTKADPLWERMEYAFGKKNIDRCFNHMISCSGRSLIDLLTDEARDELLTRCITSLKIQRKFAAESRRHYREKNHG